MNDKVALAPMALLGLWFAPWMFVAGAALFAVGVWLLSPPLNRIRSRR
jgi:hypothetical protein